MFSTKTGQTPPPNGAQSAIQKVSSWVAKLRDGFEDQLLPETDWPSQMPGTPFELARRPIMIGLGLIAVFFGMFLLWGGLAPLSGAAIANGLVAVDSSRKSIQHLEGGIVKQINVRDGDLVAEGDVLIQLDDTRTSASVDLLLGQYRSVLARVASLQAEQQDLDMPSFPDEITQNMDDPTVREIVDSQNNLFLSRKKSLQGQMDVLEQQVKQFEEEIVGLEAQKAAEEQQLEFIKEEILAVQDLFEKGLERKPRLLALQRESSEIEGRIGQYQAQIARAKQSILENELNIRDLVNRFKTESAEQLRQAETEQADLSERLRATESQQKRTDILAPTKGVIVNMQIHTVGGVIAPGQTVMEIVPDEDTRIIQARVNPRDIDEVRTGQTAQVILTAYNMRRTPYLAARVTQVSADILRDDVTGEMYYEARVLVDTEPLKEFPNIALIPGMPVEVMIETGTRTAIDYMLAPLKSTLRRGARES